jgi:putative thioredoxin
MRKAMLTFGNATETPVIDLIKDGTEASFAVDVIEASNDVPVIVDFWAPWCGPCKQLGPALEAAVTAAKGKVRMVKINVDESQQLATQLRIQSIPTVYAFFEGKPVDGFQGALSGSELKAFVDKIGALGGDGGLAEALEAAEAMLTEGEAVDAAETFAAILEEEPENAGAFGGLVRSYLVLGEIEKAESLLAAVPIKLTNAKEVEAARAQLALLHQAAKAGPEDELRALVEADPNNNQARFELAQALHASDKVAEAVDELLDLFRRDRDWNDGAAKSQLFIIFDALKAEDPIALKGRRRLSSMIFA